MQEEYGAAQPIIDVAKRAYKAIDWADQKTSPKPKYDGTHERMVKEANDSFRKTDEDRKRGTTLKSSPALGTKKAPAKTKRKASRGKY